MSLRLFARISAAIVAIAGLGMLAALALGYPSAPPFVPPWSTLAFLILGCALSVEDRWPGRFPLLPAVCGTFVLMIGAVIWGEYIFNAHTGFDLLLFPQLLWKTVAHPGRPSPLTGFHFCLFGFMLLVFRTRGNALIVVREFAAMTAITLSYFAFIRYTRGGFAAEGMSGTVAILGMLAAFAVLLIPERGVLTELARDSGPAGFIVRRLMPLPLILLAATDILRRTTRQLGVLQGQDGAAIFASIDVLAAVGIVWIGARAVLNADRLRRKAEQELSESRDELDRRVHLRTRELVETQTALQHTNAMLESLIEACPLAICAFDLDGGMRTCNAAAEAMRLADNGECRNLAAQASRGEPVNGVEITCSQEDKEMQLSVWASPILTPGAEPEGVVLIAADISEHKAIEVQLRQTQKLESLGVLAGGIAHDFNNLLTGVLGHASYLQERLTGSDATESAQALIDAGERMAKLTAQMLAYSGRGRFVIEAVDLSGQVAGIANLIRASIPKNVDLHLNLASGLPSIESDTSQLQQVIMNLIINAAEAIGADAGTVEVSTSVYEAGKDELQSNMTRETVPADKYVALIVRDTGLGMDEQTQARIFDPFYTTKFAGRGLGLSAVLGIVRAHHGAILLESQPGAGTTFRVLFPPGKPKPRPFETQPAKANPGRGLVLVVDDEETVRRTAEVLLRASGYETVAAGNGAEALELYASMAGRIRAVLLDMTMPVMSGSETLTELLARWPDAVVIASSGYDESEAQEKLGHRAAAFLQKPYTAAQLAAKVAEAIGKSREAGASR